MTMHAKGHHVVWFDMPCIDLDRAIGFYSAVLGCEVERQEFDGMRMGILPHDEDTTGGCLAEMADTTPSDSGVLIYLNCQGRLDDAIDAVEPNGGSVIVPKHQIGPHGFRAIVHDSEGNRVALHSH